MSGYGYEYDRPDRGGGYDAELLLTEGVLARRVGAWVIDVLILLAVVGVLWVVLFAFGIVTLGLGFHLFGLLPLVPFLYHVGFLAGPMSATPGQATLDLIVRRNDDLGPPGLAQAVLSTVGFYLTLAAGVIWLGFALLTVRRRTLHDLLSGLVVVRRRTLLHLSGEWTIVGGSPYA